MSNYKNVHEQFKLNGFHYSNEDLLLVAYDLVKEGEIYQQVIGNFLYEWFNVKSQRTVA